jgi:hypothetical protein
MSYQLALSDNFFGTTFGPSTPGALNLVSGQTHGATPSRLVNTVADGTVIGDRIDQANHQYDLSDFYAAALAGNLPAVSYFRTPAYEDGYALYSDPLPHHTLRQAPDGDQDR